MVASFLTLFSLVLFGTEKNILHLLLHSAQYIIVYEWMVDSTLYLNSDKKIAQMNRAFFREKNVPIDDNRRRNTHREQQQKKK